MRQPEEFINPDKSNFVCKLKKSIYELKQSAETCQELKWLHTLLSFFDERNHMSFMKTVKAQLNWSTMRSAQDLNTMILNITSSVIWIWKVMQYSSIVQHLKMVADVLTKRLANIRMKPMTHLLGLQLLYTFRHIVPTLVSGALIQFSEFRSDIETVLWSFDWLSINKYANSTKIYIRWFRRLTTPVISQSYIL